MGNHIYRSLRLPLKLRSIVPKVSLYNQVIWSFLLSQNGWNDALVFPLKQGYSVEKIILYTHAGINDTTVKWWVKMKLLPHTKIPNGQTCDDLFSAPPPILHIFDAFVAQPLLSQYFTRFVQPLVVPEVILSNQICPLDNDSSYQRLYNWNVADCTPR